MIQTRRIRRVVDRHGERFLRRVYTECEVEYCLRRAADRFDSLAARWAAKEATFKALGMRGARWKDIEVRRSAVGIPEVFLSGEASRLARRAGVVDIKLSISHSDGAAVAFVVAAGQ